MSAAGVLPWVVMLPLASAAVLLLWTRIPRRGVSLLGVGSVSLAAALTAWLAWQSGAAGAPEVQTRVLWTWVQLEGFTPRIALRLDGLSLTMLAVITGVGSLIHGYASGYMREDPRYRQFFAYMNLFVAMMLVLVLADNLLLLYLGWEGVGLCSYLLIGFWHQDPANGAAARKAFITTRVGDTAMAVGLLLLYRELKTLDIDVLLAVAPQAWATSSAMPTLIALLLLGGAVGKSAQLPLQTWLPDAMAGPTPVSALIHAATMVTAGVYLIARLHGLFEIAPAALAAVGWIGALTLLLAGIAALAQHDIKRLLAYSTMSQIGYMFLALGAGAWQAAIFHLMTHAFFKALLFLAAGSVILACHHEQDIFRMGGLRRRLPTAFAAFVVGSAALSALPLVTAGFWSKEAILAGAWAGGHHVWWAMGAACAFLTGLYSFRLLFIVFLGAPQRSAHDADTLRMRVPLFALMLLSLLGGAIALPLAGVLPADPPPPASHLPEVLAVLAGLAGIALAARRYGRGATRPADSRLRRLARDGFGFDALYARLFVRPLHALAWANRADRVDAAYGALAGGLLALHRTVLRLQNGRLRWYAAAMAAGAALLAGAARWN